VHPKGVRGPPHTPARKHDLETHQRVKTEITDFFRQPGEEAGQGRAYRRISELFRPEGCEEIPPTVESILVLTRNRRSCRSFHGVRSQKISLFAVLRGRRSEGFQLILGLRRLPSQEGKYRTLWDVVHPWEKEF